MGNYFASYTFSEATTFILNITKDQKQVSYSGHIPPGKHSIAKLAKICRQWIPESVTILYSSDRLEFTDVCTQIELSGPFRKLNNLNFSQAQSNEHKRLHAGFSIRCPDNLSIYSI